MRDRDERIERDIEAERGASDQSGSGALMSEQQATREAELLDGPAGVPPLSPNSELGLGATASTGLYGRNAGAPLARERVVRIAPEDGLADVGSAATARGDDVEIEVPRPRAGEYVGIDADSARGSDGSAGQVDARIGQDLAGTPTHHRSSFADPTPRTAAHDALGERAIDEATGLPSREGGAVDWGNATIQQVGRHESHDYPDAAAARDDAARERARMEARLADGRVNDRAPRVETGPEDVA